jgi:hypothetical protein
MCRVENDVVLSNAATNADDVLSESELRMLRVLEKNGPAVERCRFQALCEASGIKLPTFTKTLGSSPVFSRCAPGIYCVIGADVPPGLIQDLLNKRKPTKVLLDFGWLEHRVLWIRYKLSQGAINSGTATIPSVLNPFLTCEFEMKDESKSVIGTLIIRSSQAYGLRGFFRRRGGEPGDYLLLRFDLATREVFVSIGDEFLGEELESRPDLPSQGTTGEQLSQD